MTPGGPAPVAVAIVGTGAIARVHAKALADLSGQATVIAAADVDAAALARFCADHRIPAAHASLDDLLAAHRPDLVHICTPPAQHAPQVLACLHAGVSVLVEKPPALSLADFDKMAEASGPGAITLSPPPAPWGAGGSGGVVPPRQAHLATVFQHRFGSGARRLRALARAGTLGRPLLAVCHTTWFRDQAYFDVPWRGQWETEGGGPTMGHGIHQMDLLCDVLGDWVQVSALARRQARRTQTEDLSLAHVTFASGAVASVVNSVLSPREETYLRFDFERATVEVTHLYGYGDEDWRITPVPGCEAEVSPAWAASPERGVASGHRAQFAHVLRALAEGTPPPVTPGDTRRTMQLVAGIYASAFLGRPVGPEDLNPGTPFYRRMEGSGARW
jgi:predicted dehydrogenase